MYKIHPKTDFIGKNVFYLTSCHSTNDYASQKIQNDEWAEGTLVITDEQTSGKGQRGNSWYSEPGQNLTFSVVLFPDFLKASEQFFLNMAVANALFETVEYFLKSNDLRIKWPNDLYHGRSKLAGILIENGIAGRNLSWSIIGIGLNVNQMDFALPNASSLAKLAQSVFDLKKILMLFCENLEKRYLSLKEGLPEKEQAFFEENLFLKNVPSLFRQGERIFEGEILGLGDAGKIRIQEAEKTWEFAHKEFEYIL
ncbi:biotin--[acetyl-CoA-carboxylase] ligase [Marinilongibacter aquaticus]|uniref:biotin--[acetyl-CoA-carboxylase] ligase n=1 Tax=Marinilongibacter aquaticus TaxID=2975157 RepID=UPI0021BD305B|nr:biotin--[acetyl-CoA-carboxylase] ligase [Marinilongibacter aquaticus]UBM60242.1 biotin--[acetyl-CoA-carboxylase] ligase [Marinilongibacter aquaticus]